MQSYYSDAFERDMACTEAEWMAWLPSAMGRSVWQQEARTVTAQLNGGGHVRIQWEVLPPRTIALMRLPRMGVSFRFTDADESARYSFMRRFDLTTQRGGG